MDFNLGIIQEEVYSAFLLDVTMDSFHLESVRVFTLEIWVVDGMRFGIRSTYQG